jgi:hypothetical protein
MLSKSKWIELDKVILLENQSKNSPPSEPHMIFCEGNRFQQKKRICQMIQNKVERQKGLKMG